MSDDLELLKLLRRLGFYQAQIVAELAKAKPDRRKIAAAFEAGRVFATAAAVYCHEPVRGHSMR